MSAHRNRRGPLLYVADWLRCQPAYAIVLAACLGGAAAIYLSLLVLVHLSPNAFPVWLQEAFGIWLD